VLSLAGLRFRIEPEEELSAAERTAVARLGPTDILPAPGSRAAGPAFPLRLVCEAPWLEEETIPEGPAAIDWADGRVRVRHPRFLAEIDPFRPSGALFRRTAASFPLEIALRVALSCRLPLVGGVPLHAAGLVIDGRAAVFFGPSGAGKSTLAGLSPYPVLSDELVAVVPGSPFDVGHTGFWGTLGERRAPAGPHRLAALFELEKGPCLRLERMTPRAALRRLLGVALVPAGPPLWASTLDVLARLSQGVPSFRMAWCPSEPPWAEIARAVGDPSGWPAPVEDSGLRRTKPLE
jgi:hypothetical protein